MRRRLNSYFVYETIRKKDIQHFSFTNLYYFVNMCLRRDQTILCCECLLTFDVNGNAERFFFLLLLVILIFLLFLFTFYYVFLLILSPWLLNSKLYCRFSQKHQVTLMPRGKKLFSFLSFFIQHKFIFECYFCCAEKLNREHFKVFLASNYL